MLSRDQSLDEKLKKQNTLFTHAVMIDFFAKLDLNFEMSLIFFFFFCFYFAPFLPLAKLVFDSVAAVYDGKTE